MISVQDKYKRMPLLSWLQFANSITMKLIISLLVVVVVASGAPKQMKLPPRNLYKEPVSEIKVKPKLRIIGGNDAEPHSIPYQVYLDMAPGTCGGSLISENYVLTAAHCCIGTAEVTIVLGAHKLETPEATQIILKSNDLKPHENYTGIENDICLIKLPETVTLTDAIQLVALPTKADADNTYAGTTAKASGWGVVDGERGSYPDVLKYVDVKIISNSQCEEIYGDLPDVVLCTSGEDATGVCEGDSGGPLVADGVQVGVVSFGAYACPPGLPSGYARVTKFLDWIEDNSDVQIQSL